MRWCYSDRFSFRLRWLSISTYSGVPAPPISGKAAARSPRVMRWSVSLRLRLRLVGEERVVPPLPQPAPAKAAKATAAMPVTPTTGACETHGGAATTTLREGGGGWGGSEADAHRSRGRCGNQRGSESGFSAHCGCLSGVDTCVGTAGWSIGRSLPFLLFAPRRRKQTLLRILNCGAIIQNIRKVFLRIQRFGLLLTITVRTEGNN